MKPQQIQRAKEEWGYKEEDIIVKEVVQQRNALVTKS
jgi:hypothetical protein